VGAGVLLDGKYLLAHCNVDGEIVVHWPIKMLSWWVF
jgi:hypothetical protein